MLSKNNDLKIGSHVTISEGFSGAVKISQMIGATAFQIFTKSNRSWFAPKINPLKAKAFRETIKDSEIKFVLAHACYLINLASTNKLVAENSKKSLSGEMTRCADLGIKNLVFHPGSHTGAGLEVGIEQIANNLNEILENNASSTDLLLENMAGQGSTVGFDFQDLAKIKSKIHKKSRIFFCLDTCHAFAAGYDLVDRANFLASVNKIDSTIGLENVRAIHLNDSVFDCGQKKDRHANLGHGKIGMKGLENILTHPKLSKLPLILETPMIDGWNGYAKEILLAKKLAAMK